jgi:CheY-like chemotaxis protein
MVQPPGVPAGPPSRARHAAGWEPKPKASPKLVLCLLPRGSRFNPVAPLLRGYELATAHTTAQVLRLARHQAYDLYVVVSPLGWLSCAEACRRIRRFDPHTPVIVYVTDISSTAERREVLAAGAQAYIARADYAQNFAGTAGQLIMLAELRSMDALSSATPAIREALVNRLARARPASVEGPAAVRASALNQLKEEARRLFAEAGGSRANFERLWPAIYDEALREAGRSPN